MHTLKTMSKKETCPLLPHDNENEPQETKEVQLNLKFWTWKNTLFLGGLVSLVILIGILTWPSRTNEESQILSSSSSNNWWQKRPSWKREKNETESGQQYHKMENEEGEDPAVSRFREYLKLKAVHPNADYTSSIDWIRKQGKSIGLEFNSLKLSSGLSVVWLTWRGTNESLPSILLNSHMDVVPVDRARWTHDPFGAFKDDLTGNIYGRGAQDMKSVGVAYLEAIRNLKSQNIIPLRNVHLLYVPDEENGGNKGMKLFVETKEFSNLNVGFALDEGMPSPTDTFTLIWAERAIWQVVFKAEGESGHASILHDNTAAEKIQKIINLMLNLRAKEKARLKKDKLQMGDVTSINLTKMRGGDQPNVVPAEFSVTFDIRIAPSWSLQEVENILNNFTLQAGPQVNYSFIQKSDIIATTPLTVDNIWWTTFEKAAKEFNFKLQPAIHTGATDVRYIRQIGIPAFGFTPFANTPVLAHAHDEYLNEKVFLRGIQIYEKILPKLFNLK